MACDDVARFDGLCVLVVSDVGVRARSFPESLLPKGRGLGQLRHLASLGALPLAILIGMNAAGAQSLREALHRAYSTNPSFLDQQRGVPAAEAVVDRARAGYFPRVSANADYGLSDTTRSYGSSSASTRTTTRPGSLSLDVTQTLFDGARTYNAVGQANKQLAAARQTLRDSEQLVLLDAVTAYLDVLRDQTIVRLERQGFASLSEQLRLIRELHGFGDVTMTDVVQVQARVADSRARVSAAEAALKGSEAIYEQVIGARPVNLSIPRPADRLVPSNLEAAMSEALVAHPAILAAMANADAADAQVRVAFGEHSPTLSLTGLSPSSTTPR